LQTADVAIIGAGPYGLSVAAHLQAARVEYRIFGTPMHTWRQCMPEGMLLRSEGFASSISDPSGDLSFERYRSLRRLEVGAWCNPIPLAVYDDYARWFIDQSRIAVEDWRLERLEPQGPGYVLEFADGEQVVARRVVIAIGLTHFAHVPAALANLPNEVVSHSSRPLKLADVAMRRIAVVGGGQSALETAALLHEHGADVEVIARGSALHWHAVPPPLDRPLIDRIRTPIAGLGVGWNCVLAGRLPGVFRRLPAAKRVELVARSFGPAGAWWLRERVVGHIPTHLGANVTAAEARGHCAVLTIEDPAGTSTKTVDHVVAATGYRVDLDRVGFLDNLRSSIRLTGTSPALSREFECSLPGLHFIGAPAATTFGPVMRFVLGAEYAARRVSRSVAGTRH
jgi:lysine/ornithine N-monooxygenase